MERIKPSEFIAAPPAKKPCKDVLRKENLKKGFEKLLYFIVLVFGVYDSTALNPTELSSTNPSGKIGEEQLKLCKEIYDEAKARDEKLGKKSTSLLSLVAILIPLIVSALIYIGTVTVLSPWCYRITMVVVTFSLFFLLMAFLGAFRVIFIRSYDVLYVQSVIDVIKKEVKQYSSDSHGRGLLWCATKLTAMNDHKADFVRASQLFITLSVILLLLSATPLIYTLSPEAKIQKIKGDVQVTSKSIESLLVDIKNEMKSSRNNSVNEANLQKQIETLSQQMLQMEKDVKDIRKTARKP